MLLGEFADNILERFDVTTMASKKADRRNIIVEADIIRSELLAAGNYSATLVQGQAWQFNIGNDVKELPDILFMSKEAEVKWNEYRGCYYSTMPTEFVMFKNKTGIRAIKGIRDRSAQTANDRRVDFVSQKAGTGVAYGLLESAALGGGIGYEIEYKQGTPGVLYYNNMTPNEFCKVLITYLPKLSALSEDDVLPMDDTFAKMLEDRVVMAYMQQRQSGRDKVEGE